MESIGLTENCTSLVRLQMYMLVCSLHFIIIYYQEGKANRNELLI